MHEPLKRHEPPKQPAETHHRQSSLKVPHRFNELLAHPQIAEPMKSFLAMVSEEIGRVRSLPENQKIDYIKNLVGAETEFHARLRALNAAIAGALGKDVRIHKKEIATTILAGAKINV